MSGLQEDDQVHGIVAQVRAELGTIAGYLTSFVKIFVFLNLAIGWIVFSAVAARLHVVQGQLLKGALLLFVFLLPGIIGAVAYVESYRSTGTDA